MSIIERIILLLKNKGLKKIELARYLNKPSAQISKWETRNSDPPAHLLPQIAEFLEVPVEYLLGMEINPDLEIELSYTYVEREAIEKYRQLDEYGREIVNAVLSIEHKRCTTGIQQPVISYIHTFPFYEFPAAAGSGNYIEDVNPVFIDVEGDVPPGAVYIVPISGHSMEPDYLDGDRVYIQPVEDCVSVGEIGIFIVDGTAVIKQYSDSVLISLNKDYENISLKNKNWRCQGRVLGIVKSVNTAK